MTVTKTFFAIGKAYSLSEKKVAKIIFVIQFLGHDQMSLHQAMGKCTKRELTLTFPDLFSWVESFFDRSEYFGRCVAKYPAAGQNLRGVTQLINATHQCRP